MSLAGEPAGLAIESLENSGLGDQGDQLAPMHAGFHTFLLATTPYTWAVESLRDLWSAWIVLRDRNGC